MKQTVEHKIRLWYEINGYINRLEGAYLVLFAALVALLGIVAAVLAAGLIPAYEVTTRLVLLILTPAAIAAAMAFLAFSFRRITLARAYAEKLEEEIGQELGEAMFQWQTRYADKPGTGRSAYALLLICNLLFFLILWLALNYFMWLTPVPTEVKVVYTVVLTAVSVLCMIPFVRGGRRKHFLNERDEPDKQDEQDTPRRG